MSLSPSVFIIAEAGVNHNGDRDKAFALVDAAASAGASAVKFQTFNARRLATDMAPKAGYQKQTTDADESQLDMLKKLELPHAWHRPLQTHARQQGIEFLSTAFDLESLAFLETLDLPFYKIPSGEIVNGPLLWHFARTGRKLVLSTGMSTLGEVEQALAVLAHGVRHEIPPAGLEEIWQHWSLPENRRCLHDRVTLLHCTSRYPTAMKEVNLKAMDTLANAFGLPVGYSDHTNGNLIPVAAVARGAVLVEKHFTLDRNLPGPDHRASLEPAELARMVQDIRALEEALGVPDKVPQAGEWDTRRAARQKLVAARDLEAGHIVQPEDLSSARCPEGQSPMLYWDFVGRKLDRNRRRDEPG